MWDDTTDRAKEIGRWLDEPMDLDECYGRPTYTRCAMVLAAWLTVYEVPYWIVPKRTKHVCGLPL